VPSGIVGRRHGIETPTVTVTDALISVLDVSQSLRRLTPIRRIPIPHLPRSQHLQLCRSVLQEANLQESPQRSGAGQCGGVGDGKPRVNQWYLLVNNGNLGASNSEPSGLAQRLTRRLAQHDRLANLSCDSYPSVFCSQPKFSDLPCYFVSSTSDSTHPRAWVAENRDGGTCYHNTWQATSSNNKRMCWRDSTVEVTISLAWGICR
jgi:hypothetical protein